MENEIKSSGGINKAIKIAVIVLVVVIGLGIAGMYALKTELGSSGVYQKMNTDYVGEDAALGVPYGIGGDVSSPMSAPSASRNMSSKGIPAGENLMMLSEPAPEIADKKVIKNGSLNMQVDSVDGAAREISQIAKDNGGDVFSSNAYQNAKKIKTGYVTVKVPVANFEKTYDDLKKVATLVVRESISGVDVTEQYVDLQAKIKNAQAEEQAYIRIMEQAQKVSDILEVQQQLSRVRGEIESLQGRIKYLESQTDMASIIVSMTEDADVTVADSWRPWQVAKEAINSLVIKIQNFVDFTIRLVITIIPILFLYGILVWLVYVIGRKVYGKFKKKDQV
ncbi:MAG: hypothetical protein QG620_804 [Patescibacteria group bacterium]|nr:hypothetical protein [Patescibacteria group bacterium]